MNFSALSSSDKMAVYAAALVVIFGLLSIAYEWGFLMIVPVLGGLGVLAVLLMPSMLASLGSKGSLMLVFGAASALVWIIVALSWTGYIAEFLATFDVIQFLVGLAASLWLAWTAWGAFQAEGGKFQIGSAK